MNYLPLPIFAEFEIEECIANFNGKNTVYFTLTCGVDYIECSVEATQKVEEFEVCNDIDVQNTHDRDFEYLQVDADEVVGVELEHVQKIKLTEKQLEELNEYLKQQMKMI